MPSVGPKTAQRVAFHILRSDRVRAEALARAIVDVKTRIGYCERCWNIAEGPLCTICLSTRRDLSAVCVVESPLDLLAIERTSEYQGLYHVLHGVISPIDGVGPDDIHVPELVERVRLGGVREGIIATDADIEGGGTAGYLSRALRPLGGAGARPPPRPPGGGGLEGAGRLPPGRAVTGRPGVCGRAR